MDGVVWKEKAKTNALKIKEQQFNTIEHFEAFFIQVAKYYSGIPISGISFKYNSILDVSETQPVPVPEDGFARFDSMSGSSFKYAFNVIFSTLTLHFPVLTSITIANNRIDEYAANVITSGISACDNIKKLSLKECHFTSTSLKVFCDEMANNTTITHLDLSNIIAASFYVGLSVKEILLKNKFLKKLNVSDFEPHCTMFFTSIYEGILHNTTLRHFIINRCYITLAQMQLVIDIININKTLKTFPICLKLDPDERQDEINTFWDSPGISVLWKKVREAAERNYRLEFLFMGKTYILFDIQKFLLRNRHNRKLKKKNLQKLALSVIKKHDKERFLLFKPQKTLMS